MAHTYHPDIAEPIPQTNYYVHSNHETVPTPQFSLHQVNMTTPEIQQITSSFYNVQHTSHTSKPRIFPSLPYTQENPKFMNQFNFQFSPSIHQLQIHQ